VDLIGRRVTDGVGRLIVVAPALMTASTIALRKSMFDRVASSAENCTSSV
jgi:hypothetical protein